MTKEVLAKDGRVSALRAVRVSLEGGRIVEVPGASMRTPAGPG